MDDREATTSVPIHELLAKRWSPRAFDSSRRLSTRLPAFSLGKSKRSTSRCGRCGRWTGKAREVFLEFPRHVVRVSIGGVEVDQPGDPILML